MLGLHLSSNGARHRAFGGTHRCRPKVLKEARKAAAFPEMAGNTVVRELQIADPQHGRVVPDLICNDVLLWLNSRWRISCRALFIELFLHIRMLRGELPERRPQGATQRLDVIVA